MVQPISLQQQISVTKTGFSSVYVATSNFCRNNYHDASVSTLQLKWTRKMYSPIDYVFVVLQRTCRNWEGVRSTCCPVTKLTQADRGRNYRVLAWRLCLFVVVCFSSSSSFKKKKKKVVLTYLVVLFVIVWSAQPNYLLTYRVFPSSF